MRRTSIIVQFCCAASLAGAAAARQLSGLDDAPLGAPSPGVAGLGVAQRPTADPGATFMKADLNGDGALSGKESKSVAEHFDTDGDGRITRGEFDAARESDRRRLAAGAQRRAAEQTFRARDLSEDGALTGTERAGFETRDTDGDGQITLAEFAAAAQSPSLSPRGAAALGGDALGGTLGGGALGGTIVPQSAPEPTAEQLARFAKLDENEDGRLSGTEIGAADRRLDADGDGRITRNEYFAAKADDDLAARYDAGTIRVMFVGVSRYQNRPPTCATPDVRLLSSALNENLPQEKFGGKIAADDNPKPEQVPTKKSLAGVVAEMARTVDSNGTFLFYLAGRTALVGEHVFYCPPEFDAAQPVQTGITFADIAATVAECKSPHKLLLLDVCAFDETASASAAELQARIVENLAYVPGLTTIGIVAPRGDLLPAPGRTYGMFAEAVVAALDGRGDIDGDGLVSADELHAYAEAAIAHASRGAPPEAPRAPLRVVGPGPVGTFGLARVKKREPAPDLAKSERASPAADPNKELNEFVNSVGMKFVHFAPATSLVGSAEGHAHHKDDEEFRRIERTYPIYFGCHEVTQGQFAAVMGTYPSHHSRAAGYDDRYPVEQVSWTDAYEFCKRLSESPAEMAGRRAYRLPTECEWEEACGVLDAKKNTYYFHTGMTITSEQANIRGDRPIGESPAGAFLNRTQPVGSYPPNRHGLFDMHGNVAEWCLDWYVADRFVGHRVDQPIVDFVMENGTLKSVRGGDFLGDVAYCRAAARRSFDPEYRYKSLGFRVVCYQPAPGGQK